MKTIILFCSFISICTAWKASEEFGIKDALKWKESYKGPSIDELPTLPYTVISEGDGYELRRYPSSKWVSTSTSSVLYDVYGRISFKELFDYINGSNVDGVKIQMTTPVLRGLGTRPCSFCPIPSSMSFYLPPKYQTEAPAPLSENVKLIDLPQTDVYIKKFGGFPELNDWMKESNMLFEMLVRDGVTKDQLETAYFYMTTYDTPWKLTNRRNEVGIVKRD